MKFLITTFASLTLLGGILIARVSSTAPVLADACSGRPGCVTPTPSTATPVGTVCYPERGTCFPVWPTPSVVPTPWAH